MILIKLQDYTSFPVHVQYRLISLWLKGSSGGGGAMKSSLTSGKFVNTAPLNMC